MAEVKASFSKDGIVKLLSDYKPEKVEQFASYCFKLALEIDKKEQKPKNPWILKMTNEKLASFFKRVAVDEGMFLDGENVTLSVRGIQYDYKAYKNRLTIVYPETVFDYQLVYKDDVFKFKKESGKIIYSHDIGNPFDQKDEDIIGAYCIIKNRRGEFLTTLSKEDIAKHRKVAKTDSIWKEWYKEMVLKTVIKKGCSVHFHDITQNMEAIDNEANCDITNPQSIEIDDKAEIDKITSLEALRKFYNDHKDKFTKDKGLLQYIQKKQAEIKKLQSEAKGEK